MSTFVNRAVTEAIQFTEGVYFSPPR